MSVMFGGWRSGKRRPGSLGGSGPVLGGYSPGLVDGGVGAGFLQVGDQIVSVVVGVEGGQVAG